MIEQRWVRSDVFTVPKGHWKKQLPVKYLSLARDGKLRTLMSLLKNNPHYINKLGSHNRTFLWEAARRGRVNVIRYLLDFDLNINQTGSYNNESHVQISPYIATIYYDRPEAKEELEKHNPTIDFYGSSFIGQEDDVIRTLDNDRQMIDREDPSDNLYHIPPISFAVAGTQTSILEILLNYNPSISPYSTQLCYILALRNSTEMYLRLHQAGLDPIYADGTFFVTVKDTNLMRRLVEDGANINKKTNGMTPLMYLSRGDKGGNIEKISILLELEPDLNVRDRNGRSALHYASRAGFVDLVSILIEAGASTNIKDKNGQYPVDMAKKQFRSELKDLLS